MARNCVVLQLLKLTILRTTQRARLFQKNLPWDLHPRNPHKAPQQISSAGQHDRPSSLFDDNTNDAMNTITKTNTSSFCLVYGLCLCPLWVVSFYALAASLQSACPTARVWYALRGAATHSQMCSGVVMETWMELTSRGEMLTMGWSSQEMWDGSGSRWCVSGWRKEAEERDRWRGQKGLGSLSDGCRSSELGLELQLQHWIDQNVFVVRRWI